ncbi:MAG: zf-HC2 domain-containing protein [Polyangiaceae bacterium]|nr:zf-HC2 domain-containing protein [Polyangiaceae bacterium]
MDCEKFDEHVIDALYGELDELTAAALRRHVESCSRCAAIFSNLKSAREGSTLPLEEPPDDLEEKILAAERAAQRSAPWHKKAMRAAAWAGSHAMRPQLAMAALFMFVIGSSLLLLRAKPGTFGPTSVSERGTPAAEERSDTTVAAPREQQVRGGGPGGDKGGRAESKEAAAAPPPAAAPEGMKADSEPSPAATATAYASAGAAPQTATLSEAIDTLNKEGCDAALPKLRQIADGAESQDADDARKRIEACARPAAKAVPAAPATGTSSGQR